MTDSPFQPDDLTPEEAAGEHVRLAAEILEHNRLYYQDDAPRVSSRYSVHRLGSRTTSQSTQRALAGLTNGDQQASKTWPRSSTRHQHSVASPSPRQLGGR